MTASGVAPSAGFLGSANESALWHDLAWMLVTQIGGHELRERRTSMKRFEEGTAQAERGERSDGDAFLDRLDAELARGDRGE